MRKVTANSKYVKKLNRMTILNIIKEMEPVSRKQLAKITGLTPPAITGIIRELIDMKLVLEVGLEKSRGGRRPVKLRFNPKAGYVLGIEITCCETKLGMADLKNHPTNIRTVDIDMTEPEIGLPKLIKTVNEYIDSDGGIRKKLMGIAVAFPGLINIHDESIKRSINLGPKWKGFPVRQVLEKGLGLPVYIENNSNASALGERWFGGGKECKDLIYINLGEGISAGIIMNDRILHGFQGYAGEIGHIVVQEDGPLCNCGNRGCLESICGIPALLGKVMAEMPLIGRDDPLKGAWEAKGKIKIDDLISSASIKGSYSHELLKQMAIYVGKAIANVINLYNPEVIFVGGRMAVVAKIYLEELIETANSHAFPEVAATTRLKVSSFEENSGVIGACALALRHLFNPNSDMLDDVQEAMDGNKI